MMLSYTIRDTGPRSYISDYHAGRSETLTRRAARIADYADAKEKGGTSDKPRCICHHHHHQR